MNTNKGIERNAYCFKNNYTTNGNNLSFTFLNSLSNWRGAGWGHKKNKNSNYDHLKYSRKPLVNDITKDDKAITEYKELISIFVKSIETARKNKSGKNT